MVTLAQRAFVSRVGVTTTNRDKTGFSTMATTGSISSGSDQLSVANVLDFRVGDWVIVEIGGEAGAGARGTRGVGGAWPALYYANATARDADTSQASNTYCWLESDGNTYVWNGSAWSATQVDAYYWRKAIPRALWAEITNIAGNVLTLSTTASASTTNANVYFDNWGVLRQAGNDSFNVFIPSGTYYFSDFVRFQYRNGLTIQGAGKTATILKTPKGASHGGIDFSNCDDFVLSDLTIDCQFLNASYSYRWINGRSYVNGDINVAFTDTAPSLGSWSFGFGVMASVSNNGEVRDCIIKDVVMQAVTSAYSNNLWARRVKCIVTDPMRQYHQWMFQFADVSVAGQGGGCVDCEIDSNYLISGFESFRSKDVSFIRCTGRNAYFANNSGEGTIIQDCNFTIEANTITDSYSTPNVNDPVFNFNDNIGSGYTRRNTMSNTNIVVEGYTNGTNSVPVIISVSGNSSPVDVTGTYQTDLVSPRGLIQIDPAFSGINAFYGLAGRIGVASGTNPDATFTGIRFIGDSPGYPPPPTDFNIVIAEGGTVTVTNCVIDPGTLKTNGGGTYTDGGGNITNAAYTGP